MFERFTERSLKVMALANGHAQRLKHASIGTEHILLGLAEEGSGVGANAMKHLGVDFQKMRDEVERLVKPTGGKASLKSMLASALARLSASTPVLITTRRPWSLRICIKHQQTHTGKKVIEYAIEEARNLNHRYIGTEHLLLGLVRDETCIAATAIRNVGLDLQDVRRSILNLIQAPKS